MRLVNQVNERRNSRTPAAVNELMDRYLEHLDVEQTTHERYEEGHVPESLALTAAHCHRV